ALDDPNFTDVVSDDVAILHLQYSTQWDSLAHVGSLFDADGDEIPEAVYYNGFRADEHIVGPADVKDAGGIDLVEAKSTSQARARGREHGAEMRAGPRRDDRPLRPFRPRARAGRIRGADAHPRCRQGRSRARRHGAAAHRLRRGGARDAQAAGPAGRAEILRG